MPEPLTAAQRDLVKKNVELAHFLAREVHRRNPEELEIEEVVSVAYQGLVRAALRFDPDRMSPETVKNGKAFAGFARQKINGAILDWQREIDHVQRTYRQWYKQLQRLGYTPYESTRNEVARFAEALDLEYEKAVQIIRAVENRVVSINYEASPDQVRMEGSYGGTREGWVISETNVEADVAGSLITQSVERVYTRLPDTQKAIVTLRYYQHEEFQTIAAELGISLTAVRDAHAEAMFSIHRAMQKAATDRV